jgi:hypothetical protein
MSDEQDKKAETEVTQEAAETSQEATEAPDEATGVVVEEDAPEDTQEDAEAPEEDELGGERDRAVNAEGIALEEKKAESEDDEESAIPSFFIGGTEEGEERETIRVEVDILTSKKTGKVLSVSRADLDIDFTKLNHLVHSRMWFEFTVPDYEDISSYRKRCGVWHPQAQQVLIDKLEMRNYLLVWHLKDWSMTDDKRNKVELEHDEDGSLTKPTVRKVYTMHSTIIDVVMTVLERDALLTS